MGSDSDWLDAAFLEDATAWIDRQLEAMGEKRTRPIEQPHRTAWATVLCVPASKQDIFFKAVSPEFRFEIALTEYLAHIWPEISPKVLAADPDLGWMLMADGGLRLRECLKADLDLGHWVSVLPLYAQFQRETIDHAAHLLELGTPDRRLARLVEHFDRFLDNPQALVCSEMSASEVDELLGSRSAIDQCCQELTGLGIDPAMDHGDFHDGNIFLHRGSYVFFDWGDAGLTHPFFSLRTAFVSLENSLGFEENDPVFERLSAHYLQSWLDWASMDALRRAYQVSKPLASINAAVRWQYAIDLLDQDLRENYTLHIPSLLHEVVTGLRRL